MTTQEILEAARSAKSALALADNTARNAALLGMADALCDAQNQSAILAANAEDMAAAKGHISDVMLDRLALTVPRIEAMAQGIREVAALPDPVGRVLNRVEKTLASGRAEKLGGTDFAGACQAKYEYPGVGTSIR